MRVMDLAKGDIVASLARISTASLAEVEPSAPTNGEPPEADNGELQPTLFK